MWEFTVNCPVCDVFVFRTISRKHTDKRYSNHNCRNGHRFATSFNGSSMDVHEIKHFVNDIEIDPNSMFLPTKEMPVNLAKRMR